MASSFLATRLVLNPNPSPNRNPIHFSSPRLRPRDHVPIHRCSASPYLSTSSATAATPASTPVPRPIDANAADGPTTRLRQLASEFRSFPEPIGRLKRLISYAADLPLFPEADRIKSNRVMGCTAQVWLSARIDSLGRMSFAADSDSEITRGYCACLLAVLNGSLPQEVLAMRTDYLDDFSIVGLEGRARSRVNTWHNVLVTMQKKTRALVSAGEGRPPGEPFPSLIIGAEGIHAKGSYAEAQLHGGKDTEALHQNFAKWPYVCLAFVALHLVANVIGARLSLSIQREGIDWSIND